MISKPKLKKYVVEICDSRIYLYSVYVLNFIRKSVNSLLLRIGRKIGLKQKPLYIRNINNIIEASKALEELSKNNIFCKK